MQGGGTFIFNWDTTYLDLSYTFGSEMTGQIFYGHQLSQNDIEYTWNGIQQNTIKKDSSSGSAIGINGGYDSVALSYFWATEWNQLNLNR